MATSASKHKNFEESSPQKEGSKKAKQTPPEKYVTCYKDIKVARNYSYVASTTVINNAAASQLPAIKLITH